MSLSGVTSINIEDKGKEETKAEDKGKEETKAEPDPNPNVNTIFTSPKVECSGQPTTETRALKSNTQGNLPDTSLKLNARGNLLDT